MRPLPSDSVYTHADVFYEINRELAAKSPEHRRQLEELERLRDDMSASCEQPDDGSPE